MGSKTIAVRKEVYDLLNKMKLPNESFSDTIIRVSEKNSSVMDLAGIWKDRNNKEMKEVESNIKTLRKKFNKMVKK